MTANDRRASRKQDKHERTDSRDAEPRQGEARDDADAARSEANAMAAAEDAARLAEEAGVTPEDAQSEADAEEASPEERLQSEVDDLKDRLHRAMAEMENVRRRGERERQEAVKYATAPLAKDLLNVADNLRRAMESVPAEQAESNEALKSLLDGVRMTARELEGTLEKHDIRVVSVDAGDRFDPHYHEAMFEVPTDQQAPGTVVQVLQSGYMLHERLLRPARVGVAKAAAGDGSANGNGQNVDTQA